jgi:tRNA threonylcarbamoyl adenosine modification protein YjeE
METDVLLSSLADVNLFAKSLVGQLRPGALITLSGPLGVGKTTLVQALASLLGVKEKVISPTFTIMKVYRYPQGRILHVDAYRLNGGDDLGLEDEMGDDTITMIEWPEKLSIIPVTKQRFDIMLAFETGTARRLTLHQS